jgi:FkbM family methyltransferase
MHRFYRFITTKLILTESFYLLGMIFVRLSRKLKKQFSSSEKEFVTIKNFMGDISMRVDRNSYMGGSIFWNGFHHASELIFLNKYLKADMTFIDIGANQGEFTLFAAKKIKNGFVHAFEPTPFQLGLLEHNLILNKFENVSIHKFGLFDKNCTMDVFTSDNPESDGAVNEGLSSLFKAGGRNIVEATIELKVFDELFFDVLDRLDVVKIDIEGAELFALKGMMKSIDKFRPLILMEINEIAMQEAGYTKEDLLSFLLPFEYKFYKIYRGKPIKLSSLEEVVFGNFIFTTEELS